MITADISNHITLDALNRSGINNQIDYHSNYAL
jgi:hypothetical protein